MQSIAGNVPHVVINSNNVQESGMDYCIQNEAESVVPEHQMKMIEKKRRYRERKRHSEMEAESCKCRQKEAEYNRKYREAIKQKETEDSLLTK